MSAGGEVEVVTAPPEDEVAKNENMGDGDKEPEDKVLAEGGEGGTEVSFEAAGTKDGASKDDISSKEAEHTDEVPETFTEQQESSLVEGEDRSLQEPSFIGEGSIIEGAEYSMQESSFIEGGEHSVEGAESVPSTTVEAVEPGFEIESAISSLKDEEMRTVNAILANRYPYLPIEEHDYSWAQMEEVEIMDPAEAGKRKLTQIFIALMCKKNKNKTQHLILRGSKLMTNLMRRLCDDDLIHVREYLKDNKLVVSLDLAYNNITSDGLKMHLIPLLQENTYLKELIVSNNEICLQGLEALAEVSSELSLTTLRLNGNKLGPKSGEAMARLLDGSKTLVHLDISETDQNVSSLACIAAILRKDYSPCSVNRYPFFRRPPEDESAKKKDPKICSPSQLALYMRHLVAQQNAQEDDRSLLTLTYSEKSRLNCPEDIDWTLPLKEIKFKKYDSKPLVLKKMSDLKSEKSFENGMLAGDLKCLCKTLDSEEELLSEINKSQDEEESRRKPILEILFLDRILGHYHYQPLTYHFTRILSDMIKANDSLRELHLEKNSLTDSDVQVLCEGIRENKTLKLLDLSANHIGCLGMSYLAECLSNVELEALILNHNDISDHGARCLFFTLPSTKLKVLDLAHNSISDTGMMDLLYTMRKQPKILALFIWGNPLTHVSLQKVKEYLIQGWILTDSLDIQLYEVDDVLRHAWKPSADPYKHSYYTRPSRPAGIFPTPPQSYGLPLDFQHYDLIYSKTMSQFIPKKFLYPPAESNSCTM